MSHYASLFRIRLATPEDKEPLRRLIERSVRELQSNDYSAAQMDGALGHTLGLDTQLIEDGTYFAAETERAGEIVACGGWSPRKTLFGSDHGPGREAEFLDPATDAARIRAIFVEPSFARQGLGSLMLHHCEQAAVASGFRHFEMGSTLTGVPLYTLKGYTKLERVEVPLPNGESLPIYRMSKHACKQADGWQAKAKEPRWLSVTFRRCRRSRRWKGSPPHPRSEACL